MVPTGPHPWKRGTSDKPKPASVKPRSSKRLKEKMGVTLTDRTLVTVVGRNLGADYKLGRTRAV